MNFFFWIAASVADAAEVNPNGIETLLVKGLSIFFIEGNRILSNGARNSPRNPPDCTILGSCVFDNLILANDFFSEVSQTWL